MRLIGKPWIKLNDLFTYKHFKNEDETLKSFVITGRSYNVEESTYRLSLQEYTDDDGYEVIVDSGIGQPGVFEVSPTEINVSGWGANREILVESDTYWSIENIEYLDEGYITWISPGVESGYGSMAFALTINPYIDYSGGDPDIPETREAIVTLSDNEGQSVSINVTQHLLVYE